MRFLRHRAGEPHSHLMGTPGAIVLAGVLIAAAILFVFRWQVAGPAPLLLDRWTGKVVACDVPAHDRPLKLPCEPDR